ncbi:MAG: anhydro-N-acetylmuramic acid kinase [Candidatus Bathyarchaeota archaeon]|nr:anhydro-N-acetylmuramic acid kinase [Candidatus Bathyarchaeota archaeon]
MRDLQTRLGELKNKPTRNIIGLMSGTSADGITAAYTEITGTGETAEIDLIGYTTYPFDDAVRERVFNLFKPGLATVRDVCEMNVVLGEAFGDAANQLIKDLSLTDVDLIGSHGQTIWHQPDQGATLQIGEPAVISEKTGLPVIADFRKADMAVGGEGAPLTPYLDFVLHRDTSDCRVLQNIGGIANLTYLGLDVIAFDTGPGNMIIDAVVKRHNGDTHDIDGNLARKGTINQVLLDELLEHPFYRQKPPKTTGREVFGEHYAEQVTRRAKELGLSLEDLVATVTQLTVQTIIDSYENYLPAIDAVYVSGGGARNPVIVEGLRARLEVPVLDYSELGVSSEAKESVLMALLANEYVMGTPSNLPSATGADKKVVLGYATWV